MKVTLKKITVRELTKGYYDDLEEGVVGYGGALDIRPSYQREFVYDDKQQKAVIDTVTKNFPLNIMYWAVNKDEDDNESYEIIDGQQRTLSIAKYVSGDFAFDGKYFYNLWDEQQEKVLDYELDVYLCEGTEADKLDWFRTINIAGEELTEQELRNAVYHGPWVTDAKRYFSKTGCPAFQIAGDYLKGTPIRQEYLETVIKWKTDSTIEEFMGKHQHEEDASDLWEYFTKMVEWIETVFTEKRKEMKGLHWGPLYDEYKDLVDDEDFDAEEIEKKVKKLMQDEDVTRKTGIYHYILSGEERYLNIRTFSDREKRAAYEKQNGVCPRCQEDFKYSEMQGDHIIPWSLGGKTNLSNLQMLCRVCNATKSNK